MFFKFLDIRNQYDLETTLPADLKKNGSGSERQEKTGSGSDPGRTPGSGSDGVENLSRFTQHQSDQAS